MKTVLSSQDLDRAAELMNDFARHHGLPVEFDRQHFLSLAERGTLHPIVRLPDAFRYDRIDHRKCKPQLFPARADFFYLHASVAHDLISAAGAPVPLTHLLGIKKDGIVTFSGVEPFIDINISDLRITDDQLNWLARKLLTEHGKTSSNVAEAQPTTAADAAASGEIIEPRHAAETSGATPTDNTSIDTSGHATDWKDRAQELAQQIGEAKWQTGVCQVTARNICGAVASELAKDPKYHGIQGPRTGNNIRSEALKGWKFLPPGDAA